MRLYDSFYIRSERLLGNDRDRSFVKLSGTTTFERKNVVSVFKKRKSVTIRNEKKNIKIEEILEKNENLRETF